MHVSPELIVAAGFILCLVPVGLGVLVANWRLPYVTRHPSLTELALGDLRPSGISYVDEAAWLREGMQDEGDLYAMAHEPPMTYCPCPRCVERRHNNGEPA